LQTEARTPRKGTLLSGHTVQGYVRALKSFFSWIVKEEYLESNIMTGIPVPKAPKKIINSFSEEQIVSLAAACQQENGIGYRNLVMLMLMLDTGIRVSELIALELDDVELGEGFVRVRSGKGNKERIIPVGSVVIKLLWKYLNQSRPRPISENITRVFLSFDGLPLTRSGVQQMIHRCGKRAGISGVRCSPHTLRHSFAKNYLLNGGDTFSLQKILGHSSLASVRTYLSLFGADLKRQHQRFSPVDNMTDNKSLYPLLRASAKK
jgi:integrase/recombinase XerD